MNLNVINNNLPEIFQIYGKKNNLYTISNGFGVQFSELGKHFVHAIRNVVKHIKEYFISELFMKSMFLIPTDSKQIGAN